MHPREPARHRKMPRHAKPRRRTPARRRPLTVLAASAWVAVVTVLASLLVTGASPRTTATPAPGSSAQAASGAVVSDAVTRPAALQTGRVVHILRVSRAGQSGTARSAGTSWTVRPGQTLSGIAGSWCGAPADWTGLYAANKAVIGANPDLIQPGQTYSRGCYQGRAPPDPAPSSSPASSSSDGRIWGVTYGDPNYCGDGDGDGWDVSCASRGGSAAATATAQPRESAAATARPADPPGSGSGGSTYRAASGSYEACVIRTESGGNPHAVNSSSGAGGLYQFLPSTWHSLGYSGSPQDAPVSVQREAFRQLHAQAGTSPWSPSDGC
jgi:hypothetical protein